MKISSIRANNRKKVLEIHTRKGDYTFPYVKLDPAPTSKNRIAQVHPDPELGKEALTYVLESGAEGTVHLDEVLDYNQDPGYLADLLLYKLTVEAKKRLDSSSIGIRPLARQLDTSPAQLYRLLDTANYRKSVRQMLGLLHALDCEVDLVVRDREAV